MNLARSSAAVREAPIRAFAAAVVSEKGNERLALRGESPALVYSLLGCFSVTRGTWRADDAAWERRVAQRLVRFLLVHRDRPVSEDEILEAVWPGKDADRARRSLRVAASRAQLGVEPATETARMQQSILAGEYV